MIRLIEGFLEELRREGVAVSPEEAAALASLGAETLDLPVLRKSLGALLKHRDDLRQVLADPSKFR